MDDYTVGDVYESAAMIGQDMEELIKTYGHESVERLMPNVVRVLEQLELFAERRQRDMTIIEEMKIGREKLMIENRREHALKRQLQEKVDHLESMVSKDVKSYQELVSDLEEENRSLREDMDSKEEEIMNQSAEVHDSDVALMIKMKTTIDQQRDIIRQLNIELETKNTELDAVQQQIVRLIDINERLRLYNEKLRTKIDVTSTEKAEVQAQLTMQQVDGRVEDMIDGVCDKATDLQVNTEASDAAPDSAPEVVPGQRRVPLSEREPNLLRYTVAEMQQVLAERNLYKEKASCLEDELNQFKPRSGTESSTEDKVTTPVHRTSTPVKRTFSIWKFFPKRNPSEKAEDKDATSND